MKQHFELRYTDGKGSREDISVHSCLEGAQSFIQTLGRDPYPGTAFDWYSPSDGYWFAYCTTGAYVIQRIFVS